MTYLFIADLHLSPDHPRLVRGFLDLLDAYKNKNTQLYILGDWFNAWIGDDYTAAWLDEVVTRLKQFSQAGNQIYFIVGNRDFALGQKFLDQFSGQLLPDVYTLHIGSQQVRLEHGDALCTDAKVGGSILKSKKAITCQINDKVNAERVVSVHLLRFSQKACQTLQASLVFQSADGS